MMKPRLFLVVALNTSQCDEKQPGFSVAVWLGHISRIYQDTTHGTIYTLHYNSVKSQYVKFACRKNVPASRSELLRGGGGDQGSRGARCARLAQADAARVCMLVVLPNVQCLTIVSRHAFCFALINAQIHIKQFAAPVTSVRPDRLQATLLVRFAHTAICTRDNQPRSSDISPSKRGNTRHARVLKNNKNTHNIVPESSSIQGITGLCQQVS